MRVEYIYIYMTAKTKSSEEMFSFFFPIYSLSKNLTKFTSRFYWLAFSLFSINPSFQVAKILLADYIFCFCFV